MSNALSPPRIVTQDPGAHELSASESDDHFSSASEGDGNPNANRDSLTSPIPTTRVERVDDAPAHGEVPGTPAYEQRTKDAVPDEVEVVPEGKRARSGTASRSRALSQLSEGGGSRPSTPGGTPVPKTVVERVDDKPAYGEVEGTAAREMRMADAAPDEMVKGGVTEGRGEDEQVIADRTRENEQQPEDGRVQPEDEEQRQEWFRSMWEGKQEPSSQDPAPAEPEETPTQETEEDEDNDDEGFGDDFDDFNQGGGDEDFGDFDEAEATPLASEPPPPASTSPDILAGLPPLPLNTPSRAATHEAIAPYITFLHPPKPPPTDPKTPSRPPPSTSKTPPAPFLSPRSLSLWHQLVSPPPLQPPNWTRSRIRRLFLVSLGVPIDLDEILPPSKQKRLVLPNITLNPASTNPSTTTSASATPRSSTNLPRSQHPNLNPNPATGATASTTSLNRSSGSKPRPRPGPPPPPVFNSNAASLLSSTTPQALSLYTLAELTAHVNLLEELTGAGEKVLAYWVGRREEAISEKVVLEGVIENLVGFVKGRREGAGGR